MATIPHAIKANSALFLTLVLLTWWSAQPYNGPWLSLFLIIALPYQLYKLVHAWKQSQGKTNRLVAILLIFISTLVFTGVQYHYHQLDRAEADQIVSKVLQFHMTHGRYPENSEELEIRGQTKWKLSEKVFYFPREKDQPPNLFYRSSFDGFPMWDYDFERQEWVLHDM
ncbi:MAG: hypothetical protein ACRDD3_10880 [Azovibrio sp.]